MPFIVRKTISETFLERVKTTPNAIGFRYKPHDRPGEWVKVTFRAFHDDCRLISFGLMSLGVQPGEHVALISGTRYEWPLTDMAILGARGVTVPIYPSSTPEDVAYLLGDSEAKIVVLEDARQLQKVLDVREKNRGLLPALKHIVVLDPAA